MKCGVISDGVTGGEHRPWTSTLHEVDRAWRGTEGAGLRWIIDPDAADHGERSQLGHSLNKQLHAVNTWRTRGRHRP